jgi:zinc transport system substrate-binding protein
MTVNRFEGSGSGRRARRWLLWAALACLIQPLSLVAAPRVVASIGPVASLAAAVMGDLGEPRQIVRGYGSPHAYQMRPSDAASLRDADLILWIGPSLETFLERPLAGVRDGARVVALAAVPGLALLPNRRAGVLEGDAHSGEQHRIGSYDPHVWLSPFNAKLMAGAIAEELSAIDPENAGTYRANTGRLWQGIDDMEVRIGSRLAPVRAIPFVVFHDAFQYFEESFGLNAVGSVTVSPDRMPSARRIKALREKIAESGARCVFREPQFESALVRVLLEDSDARAGVLDPLGTAVTPGPNAYFELMNANTDALIECLSE